MTGRFRTAIGTFAAALALAQAVPLAAQRAVAQAQDDVAVAVAEASRRFGVPADWIWRIIRAESGGDTRAISSAGAMGLMQVMPATYAGLRRRHGLGSNPFAVRDNILAGAAYLRELHDRYGTVGMLAAYNAGPGRWEAHVANGRPLPAETRRYLAQLAPAIAPGADGTTVPVAVAALSPDRAPIFVARPTQRMPVDGSSALGPRDVSDTLAAASGTPASPRERVLADHGDDPDRAMTRARPLPSSSLFVSRAARNLP